jgi:fructose-1,6-bisphosphatase/inositol monophosphatase family enzyme
LENALVLIEYGGDRTDPALAVKSESFHRVARANVHGLRSLGSAAANLCLLAAGHADLYWEIGIHVWDVAAAILIASECGVCVVQGAGWFRHRGQIEDFDLLGRKLLAVRTTNTDDAQVTRVMEQFLSLVDDYPLVSD